MTKILLLITLIGLISCNVKEQPTTNPENEKFKKLYPNAASLLDSTITTPRGNYYKLIPDGVKEFKIEWGNERIKKLSKDKYDLLHAETIKFDWETNDYLVLGNRITKLGRYDFLLPLDGDSTEYLVENALLYDTANNLVAWEPPFKDTPIFIDNYFTRQSQPIKENYGCGALLIEFCLDTISFDKGYLYYRLGLPRLDDAKKTFTERRIQIKI